MIHLVMWMRYLKFCLFVGIKAVKAQGPSTQYFSLGEILIMNNGTFTRQDSYHLISARSSQSQGKAQNICDNKVQPLYNTIVGVEANFHVMLSYPIRVITRVIVK